VVATVQGTESYRVLLTWSAAGLTGECSCPFGQEGEFCKHCVAVGLVIIDADDDRQDDDGDGDEVGGYLASLDHAALVELLCEHAARDEDLDRMRRLRAARDAAGRWRRT